MTQRELLDLAERYLPGACIGMITLPPDLRMVMVRGAGSKIYAADGREYIDYMLGSGPLLLGHAHPAVVEAVQRQVALGSTYFALNEPAVRLAQRLVEAAPCGEAVKFQTTGSEATFTACRLARAATGRDKILKFEGGWHGGHDLGQLSGAPTQPPDFPEPAPDCDGIPPGACADVLVAPFNDLETTARLVERHAAEIAAVIVEPLQRAITPEPGFLQGVLDLCRRYGIVSIFDEIVTGFRLAWGGAQERYGVTPDLACYGKAMAGGYPLSAVVGRADLLAFADPNRKGKEPYCFVSGTLTGNPVACAAGLAALDELEKPGTYDRLYTLAAALRSGLEEAATTRGIPMQVLGDGPVLQPVFTDREIRTWRDGLHADRGRATRFGYELVRRGIYLTPGGKLYVSTVHTPEDIERTLAVVGHALEVSA